MKTNLINIILGVLLSFSYPVISHAQASVTPPADQVNEEQQIENDEGYSKDDSEYYSSENSNESENQEVADAKDDEAVQDETVTEANDEGDAIDLPSNDNKK